MRIRVKDTDKMVVVRITLEKKKLFQLNLLITFGVQEKIKIFRICESLLTCPR